MMLARLESDEGPFGIGILIFACKNLTLAGTRHIHEHRLGSKGDGPGGRHRVAQRYGIHGTFFPFYSFCEFAGCVECCNCRHSCV